LNGSPFSEESLTCGFVSDQRVFVPKRIAVLWSEMLKQVQMHERRGILDEEPRTWTRSVGTKKRSSWRGRRTVDGQRCLHSDQRIFVPERTAVL